MNATTISPISILLAEDDDDDCLLFNEALAEIPLSTNLTIVKDGEKLMHWLSEKDTVIPNVLFLDLNMPLKNGRECLLEIKQNEKLQNLAVIIFSTSFDLEVVKQLYESGAWYYLRKPSEFADLKLFVHKALTLLEEPETKPVEQEKFVIKS